MNTHINEILDIYVLLTNNKEIDKEYFDEVEKAIKKKEGKEEQEDEKYIYRENLKYK